MADAFQSCAFQANAFQTSVCGSTPTTGGSGWPWDGVPITWKDLEDRKTRQRLLDQDELLTMLDF